MPNKGRVMNRGSTKRERPWSEGRTTPPKFRAGPGGPGCVCCRQHRPTHVMKRLRMHSERRRADQEWRSMGTEVA